MSTVNNQKQIISFSFITLLCVLLLNACIPNSKKTKRSFVILAINDVYRAEGLDSGKIGGLARVKTLRDKLVADGNKVLLLHAGDFLQPSFSARINQGEAMIDVMNGLNGLSQEYDENMFVTFGNHEFDKSKIKYLPRLQQRINESKFNWLDSNINWKHDEKFGSIKSNKLKKWWLSEINGIKVGMYSITTDMTHPEYIASFDDPSEVSTHYVPFLRSKGAEVVIALTHQQMSDDQKLLQLNENHRPDIIIGGHEHYRQLEQTNNSWIIKADADALSAAVIEVSLGSDNKPHFLPVFENLDITVEKNLQVQQLVENWTQKTNLTYCHSINQNDDCLQLSYGNTKVELVAEESEIRRFETNIGNFIADTALQEFNICQADIALINSGSVRLNHNIPANSSVTRKHIEGMFPYPSDLQMIKISGDILKQMITHNIDQWTANGHWLLISGIKYIHNPEKQQFSNLRWVKNNQLISDTETLNVVLPQYLIDDNTDHDGYLMVNESMIQECVKNGANTKELLIKRIQHTINGINPQIDGRICNTIRDNCKAK